MTSPRLVAHVLVLLSLLYAPLGYAQETGASVITLGGGVGFSTGATVNLSARPGVEWLSVDLMGGTMWVTNTVRAGISALVPVAEDHDGAHTLVIRGESGGVWAFYTSCMASDPPQCTPPQREWVANLSVGYGWVASSWELRLLAGVDYFWGKRPSPRESRPFLEGPVFPSVGVWLGRRF